MTLFANGQYRIVNARFSTRDADLLDGGPTSNVAGHVRNTRTLNMIWHLRNVGNERNQFTLANAAPNSNRAYASINEITRGAGVRGGTGAVTWTAIPAPRSDKYWILAPSVLNSADIPIGLVWTLPRGEDRTQIKLAPISLDDSSQLWAFNWMEN